ncbi:SICAvar, type I [Plasmodium knowlesi strain H]|uniref:SICAvar, type I n=1 Tax=Plasmodium knowlesi (strain H) TaxID=5851 RepID=A0A1A7VDZ8_PLAKH|nr:SICAvar, type I [Plasmodium knowlesi strain H]
MASSAGSDLFRAWLDQEVKAAQGAQGATAAAASRITDAMRKNLEGEWNKLKTSLEKSGSAEISGLCGDVDERVRVGGGSVVARKEYLKNICKGIAEIRYFMSGVETKRYTGIMGRGTDEDEDPVITTLDGAKAYPRCIVGMLAMSELYGDHCHLEEIIQHISPEVQRKLGGTHQTRGAKLDACGDIKTEDLKFGRTVLHNAIKDWVKGERGKGKKDGVMRVGYVWGWRDEVCSRTRRDQPHVQELRKENAQHMTSFLGVGKVNDRKAIMDELMNDKEIITVQDIQNVLQESMSNGGTANVDTIMNKVGEKIKKNEGIGRWEVDGGKWMVGTGWYELDGMNRMLGTGLWEVDGGKWMLGNWMVGTGWYELDGMNRMVGTGWYELDADVCMKEKSKSFCERLRCAKQHWELNNKQQVSGNTGDFWSNNVEKKLEKLITSTTVDNGGTGGAYCNGNFTNNANKEACKHMAALLHEMYETQSSGNDKYSEQIIQCLLLKAYANKLKEQAKNKGYCDIEKGLKKAFDQSSTIMNTSGQCQTPNDKTCFECKWENDDTTKDGLDNCTIPNGPSQEKVLEKVVKLFKENKQTKEDEVHKTLTDFNNKNPLCERFQCLAAKGQDQKGNDTFWTTDVKELWQELSQAMTKTHGTSINGECNQMDGGRTPTNPERKACNYLNTGFEALYNTTTTPSSSVNGKLLSNPSLRQTMGCFLLHSYAKYMKDRAVCDIEKGIQKAFTLWGDPNEKASDTCKVNGKELCVPCHWQESDDKWENCSISTSGQNTTEVKDKLNDIVKKEDEAVKKATDAMNELTLCERVQCVGKRWLKEIRNKTSDPLTEADWDQVWEEAKSQLTELSGGIEKNKKETEVTKHCSMDESKGKEACLLIAAGLKSLYDIPVNGTDPNDAVKASFQRTMRCVLLNAIADKLQDDNFPCRDEKNVAAGITAAFKNSETIMGKGDGCQNGNVTCFKCDRVSLKDLTNCKVGENKDKELKNKVEEVLNDDNYGAKEEMKKIEAQAIKDILDIFFSLLQPTNNKYMTIPHPFSKTKPKIQKKQQQKQTSKTTTTQQQKYKNKNTKQKQKYKTTTKTTTKIQKQQQKQTNKNTKTKRQQQKYKNNNKNKRTKIQKQKDNNKNTKTKRQQQKYKNKNKNTKTSYVYVYTYIDICKPCEEDKNGEKCKRFECIVKKWEERNKTKVNGTVTWDDMKGDFGTELESLLNDMKDTTNQTTAALHCNNTNWKDNDAHGFANKTACQLVARGLQHISKIQLEYSDTAKPGTGQDKDPYDKQEYKQLVACLMLKAVVQKMKEDSKICDIDIGISAAFAKAGKIKSDHCKNGKPCIECKLTDEFDNCTIGNDKVKNKLDSLLTVEKKTNVDQTLEPITKTKGNIGTLCDRLQCLASRVQLTQGRHNAVSRIKGAGIKREGIEVIEREGIKGRKKERKLQIPGSGIKVSGVSVARFLNDINTVVEEELKKLLKKITNDGNWNEVATYCTGDIGSSKDDTPGEKKAKQKACKLFALGLKHISNINEGDDATKSLKKTMMCAALNLYADQLIDKANDQCPLDGTKLKEAIKYAFEEGNATMKNGGTSCSGGSNGTNYCFVCKRHDNFPNCQIGNNPNDKVKDKMTILLNNEDQSNTASNNNQEKTLEKINKIELFCTQVQCAIKQKLRSQHKLQNGIPSWSDIDSDAKGVLAQLLEQMVQGRNQAAVNQYCNDEAKWSTFGHKGKHTNKEACLLFAAGLEHIYTHGNGHTMGQFKGPSFEQTMGCLFLKEYAEQLKKMAEIQKKYKVHPDCSVHSGIEHAFGKSKDIMKNVLSKCINGTNGISCFECKIDQDYDDCSISNDNVGSEVNKLFEDKQNKDHMEETLSNTVCPILLTDILTPFLPLAPVSIGLSAMAYYLWKYFGPLGKGGGRFRRSPVEIPGPSVQEQVLDHVEEAGPHEYRLVKERKRRSAPTRTKRSGRVNRRTIIEIHFEVLDECQKGDTQSNQKDFLELLVQEFMGSEFMEEEQVLKEEVLMEEVLMEEVPMERVPIEEVPSLGSVFMV